MYLTQIELELHTRPTGGARDGSGPAYTNNKDVAMEFVGVAEGRCANCPIGTIPFERNMAMGRIYWHTTS